MNQIFESSIDDLYASAVKAFPRTLMRQHAVDPIVIETLRWTPFVGMNTLFIKGEARNEDRHYNTIILFKKVDYSKDDVKITASDGNVYRFGKLSLESTDVSLRCNCPDFRWRFAWYNKLDRSLYGSPPPKYLPTGTGAPANPMQLEGMCKHLMATARSLRDAGIFID